MPAPASIRPREPGCTFPSACELGIAPLGTAQQENLAPSVLEKTPHAPVDARAACRPGRPRICVQGSAGSKERPEHGASCTAAPSPRAGARARGNGNYVVAGCRRACRRLSLSLPCHMGHVTWPMWPLLAAHQKVAAALQSMRGPGAGLLVRSNVRLLAAPSTGLCVCHSVHPLACARSCSPAILRPERNNVRCSTVEGSAQKAKGAALLKVSLRGARRQAPGDRWHCTVLASFTARVLMSPMFDGS